METTNVNELMLSLLGGQKTRTNASDGGTEVGQDGGTSVAHLALYGELSLDVDLSNYSSNHECGNAGEEENGREDNDRDEFCEHAYTHGEDGIEIAWNRIIDCNHC